MHVETAEEHAQPRALNSGLELPVVSAPLPIYLAFKETWRNKGRFLLVSFVIALVTTLVLFVDGLAEGLGSGNIELLQKLDGELVLFQENVDLSASAILVSVASAVASIICRAMTACRPARLAITMPHGRPDESRRTSVTRQL